MIRDRIHTFREIAYKKGFPRRTLWCRPPWPIWFSLCRTRPNFFFGRRCAAGRRSAPRARPESWPAVGVWASSVHAHRLALALRRAGKSCVHGAPRSGSRRLEAERLGRLDWWQAGVLDLDSRRCWRPRGRASSSLVTARCRAVQRDGWQQQQRGSGGGGGEEQEKLRSRADAGRTAIEGELSSRRQKFSTTARALKRTFSC